MYNKRLSGFAYFEIGLSLQFYQTAILCKLNRETDGTHRIQLYFTSIAQRQLIFTTTRNVYLIICKFFGCPGGSLLNAGAFALLLILLCFGGWGEGIAVRGLILLALILLGGLLAALLCGKVGKRSNKRLVKSHKKLRSV